MKAKKALGQHFLINKSLCVGIAEQAVAASGDLPILEVGPGQGALTHHVLSRKELFKAVDVDRDMIGVLKRKYSEHKPKFIHQNFLKTHPSELFEGHSEMMLLGNFPYNISSQILFKMLDNRDHFPVMVGMFQKEVAQRVLAKPGSKIYGVPSVLIQAFYTGKTIYKVSPGSFNPPPKVDSSVILLHRKKELPDVNYSHLKSIVKTAFGVRRKMLRNSLKTLMADESLLSTDLFRKRPEHLSVEEFIELSKLIKK